VRTLRPGAAGDARAMVWDGRDEMGTPLAAGTYLARPADAAMRHAQKIVLIR